MNAKVRKKLARRKQRIQKRLEKSDLRGCSKPMFTASNFNDVRKKAWVGQPDEFFAQARIDADGTLVPTTGECKQGMDIGHDGTWGYHALVVSLANTGEVLGLINRSGNRPSHEGAAMNRAITTLFVKRTTKLDWAQEFHRRGRREKNSEQKAARRREGGS